MIKKMKQHFNKIHATFFITYFYLINTQYVSAAGLQKAKGILETFKNELITIIPIIATLFLILSGVAYAGRFIEKDTFIRWAIGIIIAGSAAQITSLLFD